MHTIVGRLGMRAGLRAGLLVAWTAGWTVGLAACDRAEDPAQAPAEDPAQPADKSRNDPTPAGSAPAEAKPAEIALGATEHRPAAIDVTGRTKPEDLRGPIAWRAPKHWTPRRDHGKPFILGEYGLTGHRDDRPALCRLISNAVRTSGKTPAEQADREVRRTRIRTEDGKSMTSRVQPKVETFGERTWHTVLATGRYRPVLPFGAKVDPADLPPGYAQLNIIPELTDVPFSLRCWAPAEVIEAETAAIRAWAASVEYPAET